MLFNIFLNVFFIIVATALIGFYKENDSIYGFLDPQGILTKIAILVSLGGMFLVFGIQSIIHQQYFVVVQYFAFAAGTVYACIDSIKASINIDS